MEEKTSTSSRQRGMGCRKLTSRGCLIGLVFFAIAGLAGWYILMGQASAPRVSSYKIDLARIRQMVPEGKADLPIRLNAAVVGEGSYPQVLVMAGSGLTPRRMVFSAFQLVYNDQTLVIDATLPEESYIKMFPGSPFDTEQYGRIQKALRDSNLILLTHAHTDHIEGITRSPDARALMKKLLLTEEQLGDTSMAVGMTDDLRAQVKPSAYEEYYSPTPGVVLMKAPGHSPGDQLIYIQLQNGSEFLLVGDVVWSNENISRGRGRPLLFRWLMREDWDQNGNEIRALHNLAETETVHMVVSHDGPQLDQYIAEGLIGDGFE